MLYLPRKLYAIHYTVQHHVFVASPLQSKGLTQHSPYLCHVLCTLTCSEKSKLEYNIFNFLYLPKVV